MTTAKQIPVVEGLFEETADGPRLLGSICATCDMPYFPKSHVCHNPDCDESKMEDATFGPQGTLWSYTVQYYPPPPPAKYDEPYTPYALGLVDLPEGLRVLARISTDDPEGLQIGADVTLVLERLHGDMEGNEVITWMFRPR
ncbi:MAG: OB-fold domain-containing protein [Chloroflexi bacterium]|nr:OB-fold domain-containing protein [Chloroflexota bacterium]